jgi:hypothetical protein
MKTRGDDGVFQTVGPEKASFPCFSGLFGGSFVGRNTLIHRNDCKGGDEKETRKPVGHDVALNVPTTS